MPSTRSLTCPNSPRSAPAHRPGRFPILTCLAVGIAFAVGTSAVAQPQVARTDAEIAAAMADPDVVMVRNLSPRELIPGTPVHDGEGTLIGNVSRTAGNTVIVSDAGVEYRVPITQLYAWMQGGGERIASRLPKDSLTAQARADEDTREELGG